MITFTHDEINLMCIYQSDTRCGMMRKLTAMRGYLDENEKELCALTDSTLTKLDAITDDEYQELDLITDFNY